MNFRIMIPAALALAISAGCATETKQTGSPTVEPTPAVAKESAPKKATPEARPTSDAYGLPGYAVYEVDGRLWVFHAGSDGHQQFLEHGEPAKNVTLIGEGPGGKTLKGAETDTLKSYMASWKYRAPGFAVIEEEGRLWVFQDGSEGWKGFCEVGEPAKNVTLIGEGPDGKTLKGAETETLKAYKVAVVYGLPGYAVIEQEGRLWVFRSGSEALVEFTAKGEPAKCVTLIGEGPDGKTVKGAERETLRDYVDSHKYDVDGFSVFGVEGRLWVFRDGSPDLATFLAVGEPAKSVSLIGEGPDGKTIRSVDKETAKAYLGAWGAR